MLLWNERHRLPDRVIAQRRPGVVPADPGEVLGVDAVVRIKVRDQDLVEPVAFLGQHPHHPAPAPVHGGGLADHDPRLQRILDVVEALQPAAELLLEPGHVLPSGLVGLPSDDPDHGQLGRVVRIDDRLDRALEHVVWLGVRRDDAQVVVLQRVVGARLLVGAACRQPVFGHVAAHPPERAVDPGHHCHRADQPVHVEDQDGGRDQQRSRRLEKDRNPGRRQQHDPGDKARRSLEKAGAELPQGVLERRLGVLRQG